MAESKFEKLRIAVRYFEDAIDAYGHTGDNAAQRDWIQKCRNRVSNEMTDIINKDIK
jgi:hypothetical protein